MPAVTTARFESEFELFKQASYYATLNDDGSEWHNEIRACLIAGYINLIQASTNLESTYIPEISRFAYFSVNQKADQSEVHVSLYSDLLPEHLSIDHNPIKLFIAIDFREVPPKRWSRSNNGPAEALEPHDIIGMHVMHYPNYIHPLDPMPYGILDFLIDEGYQFVDCCVDPERPNDKLDLRGPVTVVLENSFPSCKYKHCALTYNHQVFVDDFNWMSSNVI